MQTQAVQLSRGKRYATRFGGSLKVILNSNENRREYPFRVAGVGAYTADGRHESNPDWDLLGPPAPHIAQNPKALDASLAKSVPAGPLGSLVKKRTQTAPKIYCDLCGTRLTPPKFWHREALNILVTMIDGTVVRHCSRRCQKEVLIPQSK